MEYLYETIEHNSHIPVKIFTHTVESFPYHWHEDTEVLFVLKGSIEITVENRISELHEGNVFIVNSNALHYIQALGEEHKAKLLALQFDVNHFAKYGLEATNLIFDIQYEKKGGMKRQAYNQVRGILASMMKVVINGEEPSQLLMERHLIDLMIVLVNNFSAMVKDISVTQNTEERLMEILKYISANCKDHHLSLDRIADHFHLSPQYLSRYFKNQMGVSLKKFIDNMRMNKSLQALKLTDDRIIDIALKFGFPDAKAYYRVFKETMGMTPAEYRDQHKVEAKPEARANYFSINSKESLSKLFQYLGSYTKGFDNISENRIKMAVDLNERIGRLPESILKLTTFGYAAHGLRSDFKEQMEMLRCDIGFEYVRFHGIFCDDMMVFNQRNDGSVFYNFNHIDRLFDVLLECGLKPFLELGFMPEAMAKTDMTLFHYKAYVSPPSDMNLWTDMIEAFLRHVINRYGLEEVLSWYFEFWNEPEFYVFWDGDKEAFYDFFKATYRVFRRVDHRLKFGGFGNMFIELSREWLGYLNDRATRDGIKMDFASFHVYQMALEDAKFDVGDLKNLVESDFEHTSLMENAKSAGFLGLGDESYVSQSVLKMTDYISTLAFTGEECFITEWNASADSRDLVHDTCFMASYIVKTVLENAGRLDGLGFWVASDIFEEFRYEQPVFHGGFGLITYNGIKKPAFFGYEFLSQLGHEIVDQGEDYVITTDGYGYQMLLFNYCHYNELYSAFDQSQISPTGRYDVFKNQKLMSKTLELEGVKGRWSLERQWINRKQGSSFDAWVEMGAPEALNETSERFLKGKAIPGYSHEVVEGTGKLSIDIILEPHEIQLINLKKKY